MALQSSLQKYIGEIKNPFAKILISVLLIGIGVLWHDNMGGTRELREDRDYWKARAISEQAGKDSVIATTNREKEEASAMRIKLNDERIRSQDSALLAFKILKK